MIVGLGTDIVSVDRIAMVLERNQSQFIDRICTKDEKKYLQFILQRVNCLNIQRALTNQ